MMRVKGERRKQKRRDQIKKMDALLKKLKLVCRQTRLAIEQSLHEIEANPENYPDHLDVEQLMAELTALDGRLTDVAAKGEARLKRIQVVK
jgi:regulator of sirC expression with transglutaminase-like and TPR domain